MARHRDWSAQTWAEVYVRTIDFKQNPAVVARATGLTYQQTRHWAQQWGSAKDISSVPGLSVELVTAVRERVGREVSAADAQRVELAREKREIPTMLSADPELAAAVEAYTHGATTTANDFGLTAAQFLTLCATYAQNAV